MKTYLITGGAGFIGSNFIYYILNKYRNNAQIINLDKLTGSSNLKNLNPIKNKVNYKFIKGDICDKKCVKEIFESCDVDYVVNFAGECDVDKSIKKPKVFMDTNIVGTEVLLNMVKKKWKNRLKKRKKFVQISTDKVYGSLKNKGWFTENDSLNPNNPYSASKASSDLITKSYYDTYKIPINIVRSSNNYGPYEFSNKLIPTIINNSLKGKTIPVYGDGTNVRDWVFVEDFCRAIDLIINKGKIGEIYNIGANNERENAELVYLLINVLKDMLPNKDRRRRYINEDLIEYVKDRRCYDKRYALDSSKIKKELGWKPKTSFELGIIKTINWYIRN